MEEVIIIPIYNETEYKYHKCSGCNNKIYLKEDIWQPFYFDTKIKYCPFCGNKIVRYAEPQFEKEIDWSWLDKFKEILDKADKQLEYELFVNMNQEQRKEMIEKARYGQEYFGSRIYWNCNRSVCDIVKEIAYRKLHYSYINKLKKL